MNLSPRLVLVALLLLVLPALVTALFLARQVRWAVATGAQPGGVITGRLTPIGAVPVSASVADVAVDVVGIDVDGTATVVAQGVTTPDGRFALDVPPVEGHYAVRVGGTTWQRSIVPVTLLDDEGAEILVPVRPAAWLDLKFVRRNGSPVRGGEWTLAGETDRSWFSAWTGVRIERAGRFEGAEFLVEGLPPIPVRVLVRLNGGERTELVVDLATGPNRHTVEL